MHMKFHDSVAVYISNVKRITFEGNFKRYKFLLMIDKDDISLYFNFIICNKI